MAVILRRRDPATSGRNVTCALIFCQTCGMLAACRTDEEGRRARPGRRRAVRARLDVRGVGRALPPRGRQPGLRLRGRHAAPGPGARAAPASTCTSSTGWRPPPTPTWSASRPSATTSTRRPRWRRPWRAAHDRGAFVFAHCTAAFVLGEAGLLDGRRCTTHWRYVDDLAERYPEALVDRDVLYVPGRHDRDRRRLGGRPRRRAAPDAPAVRRPRRRHRRPPDGGAAAPRRRAGAVHRPRRCPTATPRRSGPLLAWIIENLDEDLGVDELARALAHVAAHLRPPVPRRDRHDPAHAGSPGSGCRRPRSCSS